MGFDAGFDVKRVAGFSAARFCFGGRVLAMKQSHIVSRWNKCNLIGYTYSMIKSFAHKGPERFFTTGSQAGIQAIHGKRLRLVLALLNDAAEIDDIDAPALRLHPLKGDLAGFWAVTVQANWRVIFRFENGDAHVVDYVDCY